MVHVGKVRLSEEVSDAISDGLPVVALESTVFSTLGLPEPSNRDALQRCISTIHENGAVAAARIKKSLHPDADKACLESWKKAKFQPAQQDGEPIGVRNFPRRCRFKSMD